MLWQEKNGEFGFEAAEDKDGVLLQEKEVVYLYGAIIKYPAF